jgi:hypothetical protein
MEKHIQVRQNGIFIFTLFVMLLVLLHSAGYFDPFLLLTINIIFFLSMLLAIPFLKLGSKIYFFVGILFSLLAMMFKFFSIDVWAERTGIYLFQALVVGAILLFKESI